MLPALNDREPAIARVASAPKEIAPRYVTSQDAYRPSGQKGRQPQVRRVLPSIVAPEKVRRAACGAEIGGASRWTLWSRIAKSLSVSGPVRKSRFPASKGASRTRAPAVFNICLFVAVIAAASMPLTGLAVHEWIGLLVAALLLVHVTPQWSWFASAFWRCGIGGKPRTRINLLLNASLFADAVLVVFSGAMTSQVALPALGLGTSINLSWNHIHAFFQHLMMVLVGLHLAISWDRLRLAFTLWFFATGAHLAKHMEVVVRLLARVTQRSKA